MTIKFLVLVPLHTAFSEECLARGWSVTKLTTSLMCWWAACGSDVRGFGDRVMWWRVRCSVCQEAPSRPWEVCSFKQVGLSGSERGVEHRPRFSSAQWEEVLCGSVWGLAYLPLTDDDAGRSVG